MSDLLNGIEDLLFVTLWALTGFLLLTSVGTAIWLSFRRVNRNHRHTQSDETRRKFENFLHEMIAQQDLDLSPELSDEFLSNGPAITAALLNFFKIIQGRDADKLKAIIDHYHLEKIVQLSTRKGNRGQRMRAFHVLSFLDSSTSLKTIADQLYTEDKYVRLSVARCLARRRVNSLIFEVAEAVAYAFPEDENLLADVLYRFGKDAIPRFERMAETSRNTTVIAGVLQTLILLRPENSSIDFWTLAEHTDARVRAAIVELSTLCDGPNHVDLLKQGLADESIKVKIRSLKIAAKEKRAETFGDLYRLMNDPFMWVRYWAMRAAKYNGQSGHTLMNSLARRDSDMGELAQDVMSES